MDVIVPESDAQVKGELESPSNSPCTFGKGRSWFLQVLLPGQIVSTLPSKLLGSCIPELLGFRIKAFISTVFRRLRVVRTGGGCHWFFSEMLPAINLKQSRRRQSHAGVAVKRGGGTVGEDVFAHGSLLGECGVWPSVRPTPNFRFNLDFHNRRLPTVTKEAGPMPPKLVSPPRHKVL